MRTILLAFSSVFTRCMVPQSDVKSLLRWELLYKSSHAVVQLNNSFMDVY